MTGGALHVWAASGYAAPDLEQQKHQADAQQDMTYPGNAGDRRAHSGREFLPHHLHNTAYNKHYSRQIQADVIYCQYAAGFCPGEGKALFQLSLIHI